MMLFMGSLDENSPRMKGRCLPFIRGLFFFADQLKAVPTLVPDHRGYTSAGLCHY